MDLELSDVVDLSRYPINDLGAEPGTMLIQGCRQDLAERGARSLPGFVLRDAGERTVLAGDQLAALAWHADQSHNVYFTEPDPEVEENHPRRHSIRSSQWAIAYDLLPADLPIRRLHLNELTERLFYGRRVEPTPTG